MLGIFLTQAAEHPQRFKGRYTKEKTIKKQFDVNADALLQIANKYGDVKLTSWNENRIVIEVTIKTNGDKEEEVSQRLKEINVQFEANTSRASAETVVGQEKRSWWSNWSNNNNNVNMEINYEVKLPVRNALIVDNDYGGIYLNKLEGRTQLSCDYGRLVLGELLGDDNELSFDYTSNSSIDYMKSGVISADYSDFSLEKAETVELSADYTKSDFGIVKALRFSCDYGNLKADELQNIEGSGDYLTVDLGTLSGNASLTADYGAIKIEKLSANAGNVTIKTDYASVKLGYDVAYHFNFVIDLEYAGLSGEEDFEMIKKHIESTEKYYEGYYGSQNSGNSIAITTEYGGVSFTKR